MRYNKFRDNKRTERRKTMQLKVGSYHLDVWRESKKKNPKGGRPRIRLNTEQVRKMREEGMSLREIGRELGVSKNTVAKALKGY